MDIIICLVVKAPNKKEKKEKITLWSWGLRDGREEWRDLRRILHQVSPRKDQSQRRVFERPCRARSGYLWEVSYPQEQHWGIPQCVTIYPCPGSFSGCVSPVALPVTLKKKPTNLHQPESYRQSYLAIKMYFETFEVVKCINLQEMQEPLEGIGQGRRTPSAKHNQRL